MTDYRKYSSAGSYASAIVMKEFCPKVIAPLLEWLELKISKNEVIEITHWAEKSFDIVIRDTRPGWVNGIVSRRAGFSVDIDSDSINHEGSNFARTAHWKAEIKKHFGCKFYYGVLLRYINVYFGK